MIKNLTQAFVNLNLDRPSGSLDVASDEDMIIPRLVCVTLARSRSRAVLGKPGAASQLGGETEGCQTGPAEHQEGSQGKGLLKLALQSS